MKKTNKYKKITALLLGTVVALSPSCGKTQEKKETKNNNTNQEIELDENRREEIKEPARKPKINNNATESIIEETKEVQSTSITSNTTTNNKTETTSVYNTTSTNENKGQNTTIEANNEEIEQIETTSNTTTTAIPTEDPTEEPTEEPTEDPLKELIAYTLRKDYTKNNIQSSVKIEAQYALYQLSDELRKELFNGYVHENQYGGSLGADQSMALIVALNYNQNLNTEALDYIYECITEEQFKQYCDNIDLAYYQYIYESTVDFNKYVIDESLANELNNISAEFKNYVNGTNDDFKETVKNYIENNQSNNYIINYLMYSTYNRINYDKIDLNEVQQQYFENVVVPTYKKIKGNQYK